MRYLLLLLALVTVIVGAYKVSPKIDAKNPVRTAEFIPLPPHSR
jgi:hypothetical protein